jgi:subtilisin family serine protease
MKTSNLIRLAAAGVLSGSLIASCMSSGDEPALGTTAARLVSVDPAKRIPDQYIVVFKDSIGTQGVSSAIGRVTLKNSRSRIERQYTIIPGFSARLAAEDLDAILRNPDVAYVEQDQIMSIDATRSVAAEVDLERHDGCPAQDDGIFDDHGCTGAGVLGYIVDTGIRGTHTEFTGRVNTARGYTAFTDGRGTTDCHGHGSHVASTAAGTKYGMANQATLIPVRVLDCNGSGSNSGVIAGVDHVGANCGATEKCVANMSLGGGASSALDTAVTNAVNAGVPFAVAAGNSNTDAGGSSPARAPAAITVGCASDSGYPGSDNSASVTRCTFSNYGSVVDIWASGLTILGADDASDTATQTISGTSMSSPHVAGAIAQLLSCSASKPTPAQVEATLDDRSLSGAMSSSLTLGGAQNLFMCNDFNNDGTDACACSGSPPPPPPPPPAPSDSCVQNNACGGAAPSGCFCDIWCVFFGDCCPDGPC